MMLPVRLLRIMLLATFILALIGSFADLVEKDFWVIPQHQR